MAMTDVQKARISLNMMFAGQTQNLQSQAEQPDNSSTNQSSTPLQPLPTEGLVLVTRNCQFALSQILSMANLQEHWHKFCIVRGAFYNELNVLQALTTSITPLLLIPVKFKQEGGDVTFLLRDCLPVIEKVIQNNFMIRVVCIGHVGTEFHDLDIEMTLRHTPIQRFSVDPKALVESAVLKRHDEAMNALDLSSFLDDEELSSILLCPLWPSNSMATVLSSLCSHLPAIQRLNLSDNCLNVLTNLIELPNLRSLDVSGNCLSDVSVLYPLRRILINELVLDRNPLCMTYGDESSYIRAVRVAAPYVRKLDGVFLPRRRDIPCWRQNYIPPDHRTECTALVDQFLQHFFTLIDGGDRHRLRGLYHPNALFSLTSIAGSLKGPMASFSRLAPYSLDNRNLLRISDYSKAQNLLRQGSEEVLATLCRLPATEHDPYSFAVDVPFFSHDATMIVVHGVFRDPSNIKDVYAFGRLFILNKVAENEYQIVNEMFSVGIATRRQIARSFLHAKQELPMGRLLFSSAQDLNNADRGQMTKILSRITELNPRWAAKFLEESKWDLKTALRVFTELLKANMVPAEALLPEVERSGYRK